jgi:hypothetical protein
MNITCNTFISKVSNNLVVPLFICLREQDEGPCNTFILIFLDCCQLLGVYWSGNQVGRCSHIGGFGRYLLKVLVVRKVEGQVGRYINRGGDESNTF